jgi:hypothetical protein
MNLRTTVLGVAVLLAFVPPARAGDTAATGALNVPANRIVGLWSNLGSVSPCDSGLAPGVVSNVLLFHAGGTVSENAPFPPSGVPNVYGVPGINQRNNGLGTWAYEPSNHTYTVHLRFDWWVNGAYHGYQTVDRLALMSPDGVTFSGPVRSVRYALDGSVIIDLCGDATSTRLP